MNLQAKVSSRTKKLLEVMKRGQSGRVALCLPDGRVEEFGDGALVCEGKVKDWTVFDSILTRGDIGFAEAYMDGSFEIDKPDELIVWACKNESLLRPAIYGALPSLLVDRIKHLIRKNTVTQAKKNIASHYDLGNDFYSLWLDKTLTYSSALFKSESDSLEQAQIAKYERILDQTGVKKGDHVLEIGCGWGGFLTHAVKTRGCRVTAVTISQRQYEVCKKRVADEGIEDHVDLRLQDYREIEGQFDHVVSIEMIEAVGRAYWPQYFGKVRSCLKPGGRAVIQGITIREDLFRRYMSGTDFIQQYVFPGGELLTESAVRSVGGLQGLSLVDLHAFPESYEKTLRLWRERFGEVKGEVTAMGFGDEFIRLWNFYLAYCEGAFRIGRTGVAHFTLK